MKIIEKILWTPDKIRRAQSPKIFQNSSKISLDTLKLSAFLV